MKLRPAARVLERLLAAALAGTVLAACTGTSTHVAAPSPSPTVSPTVAPAPSPSPTPSATPSPTGPKIPDVRWDRVPRGPLPKGCSTHGSTFVHVTTPGTAYATGPSLTCATGSGLRIRAVVKVATYRGHGHWGYLSPVKPSAPTKDQAPAQRTLPSSCKPGALVHAVSSFVLTWPDGHQVRYKRVGIAAHCHS